MATMNEVVEAVGEFEEAEGEVERLRCRLEDGEGRRYREVARRLEEAERRREAAAERLACLMYSVRYPSGDPQYRPRAIEVGGVIYFNINAEEDPACIWKLERDEILMAGS